MAKTYRIIYTGKGVSINDWYAGGHWSERATLKQTYRKIFWDLILKAHIPKIDKFKIHIFFNSRMDTDNVVGTAKILVDTMKDKLIKEDNKKFYRGLQIEPDESLPHNTYVIDIIAL